MSTSRGIWETLSLLQGMSLELFETNELQRRRMSGFENYRRRNIVFERIFPAGNTHAPFVARFQSRKTPFRMRRNEIIPVEH